jgi:ABC-type multidrug transport system permease subunit
MMQLVTHQLDWFSGIASAYSSFMSDVANVLILIGASAAVICLLVGAICYFTGYNQKAGKTLFLNAIILFILLGVIYIGVLGATGMPDLSGIFHVPG